MFEVFSRRRKTKIALVIVVILVIVYLIAPAVALYEGRIAGAATLIGEYSGSSISLTIESGDQGSMRRGWREYEFSYSLQEGTLICQGEESEWRLRRVGDSMLFSLTDNTLLRKTENE